MTVANQGVLLLTFWLYLSCQLSPAINQWHHSSCSSSTIRLFLQHEPAGPVYHSMVSLILCVYWLYVHVCVSWSGHPFMCTWPHFQSAVVWAERRQYRWRSEHCSVQINQPWANTRAQIHLSSVPPRRLVREHITVPADISPMTPSHTQSPRWPPKVLPTVSNKSPQPALIGLAHS